MPAGELTFRIYERSVSEERRAQFLTADAVDMCTGLPLFRGRLIKGKKYKGLGRVTYYRCHT